MVRPTRLGCLTLLLAIVGCGSDAPPPAPVLTPRSDSARADSTVSGMAPPQAGDAGSPAAVPVRFREGSLHGFLRLSDSTGLLARGALLQVGRGDTIESRMRFQFTDGSVHDERVTFTQAGVFRMLRYHLVQRGPAFDTDLDARIDRGGVVVVHAIERDGDRKEYRDTLELPADIANGMPITIIKNLPLGTTRPVHLVAFTPKPRLIELRLTGAGAPATTVDGVELATARFILAPHVGGLTGVLAELLGKVPPDSRAWIVTEDVPTFIRFEGPFYDGPIWTIELVGPDAAR